MGRNRRNAAVPARCLGQQAHIRQMCSVTSECPRLAVTCVKWNLKPASAPRGFIEGYRPKHVSRIPSNNMPYLHGWGIPGLLCTPFCKEPRCNQQGDVRYASKARLRTLTCIGLRPGLTSKPVYPRRHRPGHALTCISNHNVPPGGMRFHTMGSRELAPPSLM